MGLVGCGENYAARTGRGRLGSFGFVIRRAFLPVGHYGKPVVIEALTAFFGVDTYLR